MKIKGTNAFEQHVEKVLMLVVVVALLGVLSMQFMTKPNAVEVDGGRMVAPKDIFQTLATQAKGLDGRLVDLTPSFPEVSSVDLQASYESKLSQPIVNETRLAMSFGVAELAESDLGQNTTINATGPIVALSVPDLGAVYANAQWVAVDPYAVDQMPVLSRYITERQPYDLASVSIQATLDGTRLLEALTSAPEDSRQIPRKFWSQNGMTVMAVEVQRERLGTDGEWFEDGRVIPMPGTIQPSWYVKSDMTLADVTEMVSNAKAVSSRVARPRFPATISGPKWLPPIAAAKREASYANLGTINRLENRIEELEADIERIQTGGTRRTTTPSPAGNRNSPSTNRPSTNQNPGQNTSVKETQIQKKREQILRTEEELKELRFEDGDADDDQSGSGQSQFFGGGGRSSFGSGPMSESILDSEEVPVWTHDLAVEPGATYRYRLRVGVNNPLFGRGAQLEENNAEHQRLSKEVIAYSPWTDWSEPVLVGAREYFFVTGASQPGTLGSTSVRASGELYAMHYGYYRKTSVKLDPGDPVADEVKIGEGFVTIDRSAIDRASAAEALAAYQKSLGREDTSTFTGSQNFRPQTGIDPYGAGRTGGQVDPAFGSTGNTLPQAEDFELPAGLMVLEGKLPVVLPMVLLDIARWEIGSFDEDGNAQPSTRVYLRGGDGAVLVVEPGLSGAAYDLVSQSNSLSEDAWMEISGDNQRPGGGSGGMLNPSEEPNPFGPVPSEIWDGP